MSSSSSIYIAFTAVPKGAADVIDAHERNAETSTHGIREQPR